MTGPEVAAQSAVPEDLDDHEYLARVMTEIDAEVRRRRASGDLPARLERELDELFLAHSPVAGRGGALADALRMVDAAAYVDPVVPVASDRSGGVFLKKGLRSLSIWYMGWVTQQVSQFATATSRALHLVDEALGELRRQVETHRPPETPVVEVEGGEEPGAWWVPALTEWLGSSPGRVLHAAAGRGWLVGHLRAAGLDAYGVDPRTLSAEVLGAPGRGELDLREEDLFDHLRAVEVSGLGAVVLSGVVDGMDHAERDRLLELVTERLAPGGRLALHSFSPSAWASAEVPPAWDLAPGRPLRPPTWTELLGRLGYEATPTSSADGRSYLVLAELRHAPAR